MVADDQADHEEHLPLGGRHEDVEWVAEMLGQHQVPDPEGQAGGRHQPGLALLHGVEGERSGQDEQEVQGHKRVVGPVQGERLQERAHVHRFHQ